MNSNSFITAKEGLYVFEDIALGVQSPRLSVGKSSLSTYGTIPALVGDFHFYAGLTSQLMLSIVWTPVPEIT